MIGVPTIPKRTQGNIILNTFISRGQLKCLFSFLRGEEKDYYKDLVRGMIATIENMPKTYEQDGQGDQAVVHLHYFLGNMDWWITEKDKGDGSEDQEQHQAFGLADLGHGGELGYISVAELIENGVELDLNWTPKTLEQVKKERD